MLLFINNEIYILGHLTFNLAIGLSQGFHIFSASFLFLYMVAVLFQVETKS